MKISLLIPEEDISKRVKELALAISNDYAGKELCVVGVLKGAFVFMSDLIRQLSIPARCEFVKLASYGKGTESSGKVRIDLDLSCEIKGKDLLVVEDIIDTGITIAKLKRILLSRKPSSLKICALLDKPTRREVAIKPDYTGFEIPNRFVVGYGLDWDERFRYLPYIGYIETGEVF